MLRSSPLIKAAYNPSKGKLFACLADSSSLQVLRCGGGGGGNHENHRLCNNLPSPCTAVCCGESGIVVAGTESGALLAVIIDDDDHKGGGDEASPAALTPRLLYQHPQRQKVDVVAISDDDDTVVAAMGLEVVVLSRVLLSTIAPVLSVMSTSIPEVNAQERTNSCYHKIHLSGDTILLCENSGRGGIAVIQAGKYLCRLLGSHEDDKMSARAFRFVGCDVVQRSEEKMVVTGMENWGGLCVWDVPLAGKTSSVPVAKTFHVPMRINTIATDFTAHRPSPNLVCFAIAYEGDYLTRSQREELEKENKGWISVFKVPVQSLLRRDRGTEPNHVRSETAEDGTPRLFVDLDAFLEGHRLHQLEQTDLDAFEDRKQCARRISFLVYSSGMSLVTATLGLPDGCKQAQGNTPSGPCIRVFEKKENSSSFVPVLSRDLTMTTSV